jgi:hypothetical protein
MREKGSKLFPIILLLSTIVFCVDSSARAENTYYLIFPVIIAPQTNFHAQTIKNGEFYGVWATIDTATPVIRESGFSYASINIISGAQWVETGWSRSSIHGCIPKFLWAIQPGYGNYIDSPLPTVGTAY